MSAWSTQGGKLTAAIAAAAGGTVVKAAAGRLARVLVTVTGTAGSPLVIYDNASTGAGTMIGVVPGNSAAGTIFDLEIPAVNGIYVVNVASGPAVTISYE